MLTLLKYAKAAQEFASINLQASATVSAQAMYNMAQDASHAHQIAAEQLHHLAARQHSWTATKTSARSEPAAQACASIVLRASVTHTAAETCCIIQGV